MDAGLVRNSASVQATSPVGVTTALADEDLEIERESSLTVGKPHDGCHDMLNLKSRAAGGAADCIWVEDTPWVAAGLNFSAGRAFVKVPMKRICHSTRLNLPWSQKHGETLHPSPLVLLYKQLNQWRAFTDTRLCLKAITSPSSN